MCFVKPGSWQFPRQSSEWDKGIGDIFGSENAADCDKLHNPHWSMLYVWDETGTRADVVEEMVGSEEGWLHRPRQSLLADNMEYLSISEP